MKLINTATNTVVAEIVTSHPLTQDELMDKMGWDIDEWGDLIDCDGYCIGFFLDDFVMEY